jgi:hypothetical protein
VRNSWPGWDPGFKGGVKVADTRITWGMVWNGDEDVAAPFHVGLWQVAGGCVSDFRGHFLVSIRARNGWRP